jgi:peptide deformylase
MSLLEEFQPEQEKRNPRAFEVRQYPDDMLKVKASPWIQDIADPYFQDLLTDLETTMVGNRALGLAGPQVGIPYRVLTIMSAGKPLTMINPCITGLGGAQEKGVEGCLSFPGLEIKVSRCTVAVVKYVNRQGGAESITLKGSEARAVQHEIDHLDGVVFIDRIPKVLRSVAMKKYNMAPRVAKQGEARLQKLLKQFAAQGKADKKFAPPVEKSTATDISI